MPSKIKLIYILGTGFSGSTLLSLVLGTQKGVLNLGEVWALENDYVENRKCSCGKNVMNCNYWQWIINSYQKFVSDYDQDQIFDFIHGQKDSDFVFNGLTLRQRVLHHLTLDSYLLFGRKNVHHYRYKNYIFFKFILNLFKNKYEYVVDSSKSVDRLMILNTSNLFDIFVIFLTRDGMSIVGKQINNSSSLFLRNLGIKTFEKTIRWELLIRRCLKCLEKLNGKKCYRTTYEKFSTKTEHIVSEICMLLDIDYNPNSLDRNSNEYFSRSKQHIFTGNSLIEKLNCIDEIKYIERWKSMLTSKDRIIFKICGGEKLKKKSRIPDRRNKIMSKGKKSLLL